MTVLEQIRDATDCLSRAGVESPKLEAEVFAAHCLGQSRSFVLAHGSDELELHGFDQLVARRASCEPLAYILGWREFYGRPFIVTPAVLIPRHETEILVETVLKLDRKSTVLDIGTGSGCIAVSIALESPGTKVTAVDISSEALQVAQENAEGLGADIEIIESDLFSRLQARMFDVIASNPPYVAEGDDLAAEVKNYEPHGALYAEDEGTAIYKQIARQSRQHLNDGGHLVIEIGDGMAEIVARVFLEENWQEPEFIDDLDGNKRVAVFQLTSTDLP